MAQGDRNLSRSERWGTDSPQPPSVGDTRALPCGDAAELLQVSCETLQAWDDEFGFPSSVAPRGAPARYPVAQLLALREALSQTASVTSAVLRARRRLGQDPPARPSPDPPSRGQDMG